jgi:ABC-type microcin C transport system duplicated ATPase subunit YejF
MMQGEIVKTGAAAEVLSAPRHAYAKRLLAAVPKFAGAVFPAQARRLLSRRRRRHPPHRPAARSRAISS